MSEQWTTVIHDASEAPLKDGGYFIEISYPSGIIDWTAGQFDSKNKRWYSKEDMSFVPISRWCEKPPAQKKKEKREVEVNIFKDGEVHVATSLNSLGTFCTNQYIGKGKLIFEE